MGLNLQRVRTEVERAQALFARALEIDPSFSEARRAHALTHVLLLFSGSTADLGLLYKAEEELRQVASEAPDLFTLPSAQTAVYIAQARKELVPVERLNEIGRRYPQHLVFAIHAHAAWFGARALAAAGHLASQAFIGPLLGALSVLYGLGYVVVAFRVAYDVPTARAIRDALVVIGIYTVCVVLAAAIVVLMNLPPQFRQELLKAFR